MQHVKRAMMPMMPLMVIGPPMDPVPVEAGKSMHLLLNMVQHQVPNTSPKQMLKTRVQVLQRVKE
jgi:hypothetical protein